jgi:quercetin dioxygenase-like cupin family protein
VGALGLTTAGCGDDPATPAAGEAGAATTVAPPGTDVGTTASTTPTPAEGETVRLDLADTAPADTPGLHLWLQEVVIGPHTQLATHVHEGVQIASIREGVLTYHVLSGSVEVRRADGSAETFTGPMVGTLDPGDSVVEPRDAVHYGENGTDGVVVITLAALVDAGGPVSTPVAG